ncbi:hypothetical protein [Carnobacterium alterfunditum]|uniref:hypothetical protein n=1 Tax=Carnobacterium alterfunditum TaxID=28230 RepID=UPI00359355C6
MIPFIILTIAAIIGIVYGSVKQSKLMIIGSAALLVFIIIFLLVYTYLYSENPY